MRGRKPKPTALRIVDGSFRADRHRSGPKVTSGPPSRPEFLTGVAAGEWDRVVGQLSTARVITDLDTVTLAAYCEAVGRWRTAEDAIAKMAKLDDATGGLLVRTSNGNLIQNPLVGVTNKSRADAVRFAAELGLTPVSRARVSPAPDDGPNEAGAEYFA